MDVLLIQGAPEVVLGLRLTSLLLVTLVPAAAGEPGQFSEPAAVVVHVTENDLNRILQDIFFANGGPVFSGHKPVVSSSISELDYAARISTPRLRLDDGALATLRFEIEDAEVHIGRIERRIIGRRARCEDIDILLHPERSLDVSMEMQFHVADRALQVQPTAVSIPGASRAFHLRPPSRCRNKPLPKWLLWWLGKPRIRRQLDRIDDKLLESIRRSTADLERDRAWSDGGWSRAFPGPSLEPRSVETIDGGLRITLAAGRWGSAPREPPPLPTPVDGSFVAVSARLLNAGLAATFEERSERRSRPSGELARLFRGESILTLIPGLRSLDSHDGLWLNFRFGEPPRIDFRSISADAAADRALITIELGGIEMELRQESAGRDELLGTLQVDHVRIAAIPYRGPLGGVSFELLENEWSLSSRGLVFDEPLLAATLQELVFAELFETSYEPLARDGFTVARTRFRIRGFRSNGGYLLVEFDADATDRELNRPARRAARTPARSHGTASE